MRIFAFMLILSLAGALPAFAADTFGKGVSAAQTTAVSALVDHPDEYVGKTVRVEGLVTDVCKRRGCWMAIASDREFETIRFKVKDGDMVFPPEVKGRHAIVEGTFNRYELTLEQTIERAKHQAEEHGQEFDPESITQGEVWYQIDGTGAVVD